MWPYGGGARISPDSAKNCEDCVPGWSEYQQVYTPESEKADWEELLRLTGSEREAKDSEINAKRALRFATRNPLSEIDTWAPYSQPIDEIFGDRPDCPDTQLYLRLLPTLRRHPGSKRPGVLRNLTKRQYVLDSTLAESRFAYSLGEAVLIRTKWTNGASTGGGTDEWTGDRFDIRSIEDIPSGWTDVSSETIDLLVASSELRSSDPPFQGLRAWVE
ncbi:hypothetical protein F4819DRAFT_320513 [Hypoxylon fuscum]|nr:hypothetical protein F4819DRAFT_320513 [Hypoxylon fuscum]